MKKNKSRWLWYAGFVIYLLKKYLFTYISGEFALLSKAIDSGIYIVLAIIGIYWLLKYIRNMDKTAFEIGIVIISIAVYYLLLFPVVKPMPYIIWDVIEGRHSTVIEVSDMPKEMSSSILKKRYYLYGTLETGENLKIEVDLSEYLNIYSIDKARFIRIYYWKHTNTFYSYENAA